MRKIPVDSTRVRLLGTGKAAARAVYAELSDGSRRRVPDQQDKNEQGVPMWTIDVIVEDEDADRLQVAGVKVPSYEPPVAPFGQPITFVACSPRPMSTGRRAVCRSRSWPRASSAPASRVSRRRPDPPPG